MFAASFVAVGVEGVSVTDVGISCRAVGEVAASAPFPVRETVGSVCFQSIYYKEILSGGNYADI